MTLPDAKTHLGITVDTDDAELTVMITAAEAALAKMCGPLSATATTSIVDGGGRSLPLPVSPVISLTSVTASDGTTIATTDLSVLPPGLVTYTNGGACFPALWYTVVYQAGRATCPADLLLADKELVRHLWATQRGGAARPGPQSDPTSPGFSVPYRVQELIAPHLRPGFA